MPSGAFSAIYSIIQNEKFINAPSATGREAEVEDPNMFGRSTQRPRMRRDQQIPLLLPFQSHQGIYLYVSKIPVPDPHFTVLSARYHLWSPQDSLVKRWMNPRAKPLRNRPRVPWSMIPMWIRTGRRVFIYNKYLFF